MMQVNIINFILFQAAWFTTILSAAKGLPFIGVLFTLLWMCWHLMAFERQRNVETKCLAFAFCLGFLLELMLLKLGYINYPAQTALLFPVPLWMLALWVNLAATLNYSLSWLKGRFYLASLLGTIAGPLAYFAGAKFGAIELNGVVALIAVAFTWSCALPLLFWFAEKVITQVSAPTHLMSNSSE